MLRMLTLLLALLLSGCAPALISRATLAENLALVLSLEKRSDNIQYQAKVMSNLGILSVEAIAAIKQHNNTYYPYYLVANVYLANGQLDKYAEAINLAEIELTAIEIILKGTYL